MKILARHLGPLAAVVIALVVGMLPLDQQTATAQTQTVTLRWWRCLATGGAALGRAVVDACDTAMPRPSSIRLGTSPRKAAALVAPPPPGSLAASVLGHAVVFSWAALTTANPADSYVIEAGSARGLSDLANTDIGSPASTMRAIDVPSGSYFVRVRARSAGGTSAPSNEILVTVPGDTCPTTAGAPGALNSVVNGATVTLTWQAPSAGCAPAAYVIEAGSAAGLSNLASFSTGNTATSLTVSDVASGVYYVRVRSLGAGGTSGASNEVQVVVGTVSCTGPPSPPSRLMYGTNGATARLYWDASPGAVLSYIIEAGSATGLVNIVVSDTGSAATSFAATAADGTYYVRLRAKSNCGTSTPSSEIAVVIGGAAADTVPLLIADIGGERLTRMTDIAGGGWETGPTASGVAFHAPVHIAQDARGRIYLAEQYTCRIVRVDDLAGNGWKVFSGVGSNRIEAPGCGITGVAVDPVGRIYIAGNSHLMRMDDMDGAGWVDVGPTGSGPGSWRPAKNVIFDAQGRIYIADELNGRIDRMDDMQGTGWITFGSKGDGIGQFNMPEGLAFDRLGRLYITEKQDHHRIARIDDMTGAGWVTFGSNGAGVGQFGAPHDIVVSDAGKIYVADTNNARIVRIDDMTGAGWTTFGKRTIQPAGIGACPGPPECNLPGVFEFIAPKGMKIAAQ